jgi:hypothetical protein
VSKPYCETVNDPRLGTGGYPNQGPPSYHISNRQLRAALLGGVAIQSFRFINQTGWASPDRVTLLKRIAVARLWLRQIFAPKNHRRGIYSNRCL